MAETQYTPRLKTNYNDSVRASLIEKFQYANEMQVPRLEKVVLNMGVGETTQDTKKVNSAFEDLQSIAGQ
ncbi:MAG: 50S ribosomal protein L5, partial [Rhodobiaceae bacterium]